MFLARADPIIHPRCRDPGLISRDDTDTARKLEQWRAQTEPVREHVKQRCLATLGTESGRSTAVGALHASMTPSLFASVRRVPRFSCLCSALDGCKYACMLVRSYMREFRSSIQLLCTGDHVATGASFAALLTHRVVSAPAGPGNCRYRRGRDPERDVVGCPPAAFPGVLVPGL